MTVHGIICKGLEESWCRWREEDFLFRKVLLAASKLHSWSKLRLCS